MTERLPLDAMVSGKKERFTIHFGVAKDFRNGPFTGRTVQAVKMRLKRTTLQPAG
jgi:hypothetical protein